MSLTVHPVEAHSETRRRLAIPAGAKLCVYAGKLSRKQGLETLLEAARLALAKPSEPDLLFVLAGTGSHQEALAEVAAELSNVVVLLHPTEEVIPDLLDNADMLLICQRPLATGDSLDDQLGRYLASGRPIVASVAPAGRVAAKLKAADAGIIVEPGNSVALLSAVRRIAKDPDIAASFETSRRCHAGRCQPEPNLGG